MRFGGNLFDLFMFTHNNTAAATTTVPMLAVGSCQSLGMVLPVGVQGTVYLDTRLRDPEEKGYAAAGLLAFRRSTGGVEVLLGRQSLRQGRGRAGTWSFIGGKRDKDETSSVGTAAREAYEESMGHVTVEWLTALMAQKPAVLWQPVGSYALYLAEVEQPGDAAVRHGYLHVTVSRNRHAIEQDAGAGHAGGGQQRLALRARGGWRPGEPPSARRLPPRLSSRAYIHRSPS